MNYLQKLTGIIIIFFLLAGCRREIEKPQWDTRLLTPLIKTSIGLDNILSDTTYELSDDSSIVLAFQHKLDSFSLNVLDTFTAPPFIKNVKLSSLQLISDTIVHRISLGQLANQMMKSSDIIQRFIGGQIIGNHGKVADVISLPNLSAGPIPLDISQWFEEATLLSGNLKINLTNDLPVDLGNIQFQITNQTLVPADIASLTFTNLLSGTSDSREADLSGKKIEGNLVVSIPDIDIIGKDQVLIDTSDALILEASIRNITVSEAKAIFPAQNVVDDRVEIPLGNTDGLELKETILKSAVVTIEVFSTLDDTLYFSYKLPNAVSPDGVSFETSESVSPSVPGSTEPSFRKVYDFAGYSFNLQGAPGRDTVNTFFSDLTGRIKQSLEPIYLSLDDSLEVRITMSGIVPAFIRGYIEKDTVFRGEQKIDLFETLNGDQLDFEKAEINLLIENSFGISGVVTANSITSKNNVGETVVLDDPELINSPKTINPATDNPLTPAFTRVGTDKASPLISNFPTGFSYEFAVKTGTSTNGMKDYTNFAYESSYFKPTIDIAVPLAFAAKNLSISDTVEVSPEFSSSIRNGTITIIANNGFPLNLGLTLQFLDDNGLVVETLNSPTSIEGASIDAASGKVMTKRKSKIAYSINETVLHNIQNSEKMVFKVNFDTTPEGVKTKLYLDYTIDFSVTGDITYRIQ